MHENNYARVVTVRRIYKFVRQTTGYIGLQQTRKHIQFASVEYVQGYVSLKYGIFMFTLI